jgi:hypothetical protein
LCFRSIQSEQQAIVEQRGVIDAIVVADEGIGDAAQFQQTIPVCIVSCESRNFQPENDTYMGESDFAGEAGKS